MNFLYRMFSDVNGEPSTNRIISAFVTVFPLIVWSAAVFKSGVWVPIPDEVLWLVGGGLTSKVAQRVVEQKNYEDVDEKVKLVLKSYLEKMKAKERA